MTPLTHSRERYQASRMVRRLEKRQKEMLLQIEDERRNTGQFKDQARLIPTLVLVVVDSLAALSWLSTHRLKRQTVACVS